MQVEGVRLDKFTFMQVLKACSSITALEEGRHVHAQIINSNYEADITLGNCLANMYSKCGSIEDACRVFNDMEMCNVVGWSAIMQGYIRCGKGENALRAFHQMQLERVLPDSTAFVAALNACSTIGALEEGRCIHAQVIESGYETDVFVVSCLVNMYSENQSLEDACRTFNEVALHDVVCWNAMIVAFMKFGQRKKALQLFKQMQREFVRPNKVTFVSVLNACASSMALEEGKRIHVQIIEAGYESDCIVGACLVDMYSKCGDLKNACMIFNGLLNRDVVCWNSMMAGYVKSGHGKKALELYQQMQQSQVEPTGHTFASLLNACSSIGSLKDGVRVHLDAIKSGCELNTVVASCLVDMYAKCGSIEDACKVFDSMPTRDVVAWSAMVVGYVKCGQGEKALELFRQMQDQHVELDSTAFVCVLNACANVAALEVGKLTHAQIIQKGYELDTAIGNCLVDMYAKCGSIEDAFRVFENMSTRDVVSWNTMIAGYAMHGLGKEACCIFEQMKEKDARMDSVTFVGLLSACSHAGRFDEGHYYFECLSSLHGILATVEHYNCMVDLLGRSGFLDEALDMIKKISCRPTISTFLTLLGACRIHGNSQMGEWLAKQVLALDPKNPSGYVLLSNIYASSGEWDSGERVQQVKIKR
ncbi:hypothetical protein O6H91_11G035300 [Diphasiastrum complanatum]|nr:hypothetical protein O6H91_11G035300 [Diphasiastrum complanatum]